MHHFALWASCCIDNMLLENTEYFNWHRCDFRYLCSQSVCFCVNTCNYRQLHKAHTLVFWLLGGDFEVFLPRRGDNVTPNGVKFGMEESPAIFTKF